MQLNLSMVSLGTKDLLSVLTDCEDLCEAGPILNYPSLKIFGSNLLNPLAFLQEFGGFSITFWDLSVLMLLPSFSGNVFYSLD
jgi:hypothetical protein